MRATAGFRSPTIRSEGHEPRPGAPHKMASSETVCWNARCPHRPPSSWGAVWEPFGGGGDTTFNGIGAGFRNSGWTRYGSDIVAIATLHPSTDGATARSGHHRYRGPSNPLYRDTARASQAFLRALTRKRSGRSRSRRPHRGVLDSIGSSDRQFSISSSISSVQSRSVAAPNYPARF